jgi:beta-lactamase regulating signal transducer with metallopeptidase domain
MNFAPVFHNIATAASERLLYSAIGGTLLAILVGFLLQLFPRRDSRTNFAVWFSTLLATAILPLVSLHADAKSTGSSATHALFTISSSWAWYAFMLWAVVAVAGLARVVLATIQVRKLRSAAVAVDMESLPPELRATVDEARVSRPIALLMSREMEVPTAIGFYKPAIILPAWLLESTPAEELKYILLHELAHLRRRDDWTNLAQKVLKALLFFLPSVWWIERRLSLDREMACDDAVLAHSGTPRGYAECLARVAERSFLRRQLALAQAAVGRVRQLTARVAMILDPNRPRTTHLWKPVIPVVLVLAGLCALPASFMPELVSFSDGGTAARAISAQALQPAGLAETGLTENHSPSQPVHASDGRQSVRAVAASLWTGDAKPIQLKAKASPARKNMNQVRMALAHNSTRPAAITTAAALLPTEPEKQQYITVREELFFVVTHRTASGEQQSWQMHVWQLSFQPAAKAAPKPRKI